MSLWTPGEPYWTPDAPQWHELPDGLATGGQCHSDVDFRAVARIFDTVVDCRAEARTGEHRILRERGVRVEHVPTGDDGQAKGEEWFGPGVRAVLSGVGRGQRVLVHCAEGINRGPSMAYAALLCLGHHPKAAWHHVSRRPCTEYGICYAEDADEWYRNEYLTGRSVACKVML